MKKRQQNDMHQHTTTETKIEKNTLTYPFLIIHGAVVARAEPLLDAVEVVAVTAGAPGRHAELGLALLRVARDARNHHVIAANRTDICVASRRVGGVGEASESE